MNQNYLDKMSAIIAENSDIPQDLYTENEVKRGLRNKNGTGVLVGLTKVGDVHGYLIDDGEKIPDYGRLKYRGVKLSELVNGFQSEGRFGFEETAYLLLFGSLPNQNEYDTFRDILAEYRELPEGFTENMIFKFPSKDIMNKIARSILVSYSFDENPDDISIKNVLKQCITLIAQLPVMAAYGYIAQQHYHNNKSLVLHRPKRELSHAENFLHMLRVDNKYSKLEAETLDLCLAIHAEHGGGNNSSFVNHVISSSGTDTYSAMAASVGSLKGPKHGGANIRVRKMMQDLKANVSDIENQGEIKDYIAKILKKEAFDGSGLVYGIGHAVYTLSDPRAVLLKEKASKLAKANNYEKEYNLYKYVAEVTPEIFADIKQSDKVISPNVDFYSGMVYDMLGIPEDLYVPLFAVARIAGWSAHRMEEIAMSPRIMRPAYKNVTHKQKYIKMADRD